MILANDFSQEADLNFTPYQQAQIGVTKHSSSLAQSNPLYAKAQEQREGKPTEPQLSTTNVKKVWGGSAPVEESKPVVKKEEDHYTGSANIINKIQQSRAEPAPKSVVNEKV